jgi:hypothetical protein
MAAYPPVVGIKVDPAGGSELIAHALPCAQQARLGRRQAEAVPFGEFAPRLAGDVARLQDGGVLGCQLTEDPVHTACQRVDWFERFCRRRLQFGFGLVQRYEVCRSADANGG